MLDHVDRTIRTRQHELLISRSSNGDRLSVRRVNWWGGVGSGGTGVG